MKYPLLLSEEHTPDSAVSTSWVLWEKGALKGAPGTYGETEWDEE